MIVGSTSSVREVLAVFWVVGPRFETKRPLVLDGAPVRLERFLPRRQ